MATTNTKNIMDYVNDFITQIEKEKLDTCLVIELMIKALGKKIEEKEIVMEAVKKDGRALRSASKELRNNPEIVMEAVKQCGYALGYASKELQNDREIVMEAVKHGGDASMIYYNNRN